MDDLVQAGTVALLETADSFDPARGITYWGWGKRHVRFAIWRALNQSKPLQFIRQDAFTELLARDAAPPGLDNVELVRKCLRRLTDKERETIEALFGLNGAEQVTARQLADREGVTPQAISARLCGALRRMKKYLRRLEDKRTARHRRLATPA